MRHIRINADETLLPIYKELYDKKIHDFVVQYGTGPHYMVTTNDEKIVEIASEQKGAVELERMSALLEFKNMNGYSLIGNESLIGHI